MTIPSNAHVVLDLALLAFLAVFFIANARRSRGRD
jgi:hypothetical protein